MSGILSEEQLAGVRYLVEQHKAVEHPVGTVNALLDTIDSLQAKIKAYEELERAARVVWAYNKTLPGHGSEAWVDLANALEKLEEGK